MRRWFENRPASRISAGTRTPLIPVPAGPPGGMIRSAVGVSPVHQIIQLLGPAVTGWAPDGLRRRSALKIAPSAAPTGHQHRLGAASTLHIVHCVDIRSSLARSLGPHPSSDRDPRCPSVDSGLADGRRGLGLRAVLPGAQSRFFCAAGSRSVVGAMGVPRRWTTSC